jgi:hypothetical protein
MASSYYEQSFLALYWLLNSNTKCHCSMTLRGKHTHTHTLHRLGSNLENFPQTSTNSDKCRKGPSRHIDLFPRSRSERQIQTLLFLFRAGPRTAAFAAAGCERKKTTAI